MPGTFVKVLMKPVSGKSASAKFYTNTKSVFTLNVILLSVIVLSVTWPIWQILDMRTVLARYKHSSLLHNGLGYSKTCIVTFVWNW